MTSHELPTKSRDEYRQLAHIGRGAFGDVFLCEHTETGEHVCMKEVNVTFLSPLERSRCLNEVKLLQLLPVHPNIVGFREAFWDQVNEASEKFLVLILEYADAGDLEQFSRSLGSSQMKDDEIRRIFRQVAQAVCHLHSHRVVHRDLKCGNMFLSHSGRVVIGDFGTSKLLPSSSSSAHELEAQDLTSTVVGSPLYMSPEQLEGEPHGFATDIWSLGCVLYELFSGGKPAFAAPSYPAVIYRITTGNYGLLDTALVSLKARNLIASMLRKAPQERPTIMKILQSPWLQKEGIIEFEKAEFEDLAATAPIPSQTEAEMAAINSSTGIATPAKALPPPAPVCMALKTSLRPRNQHKNDVNRAISPLIRLDIQAPPLPRSSKKQSSPAPAFPFKHYNHHINHVQSNSTVLEVRGVQIARSTRRR